MNATISSIGARLLDVATRELNFADLLRALIVLCPVMAAYFLSGEAAVPDVGLIATSLLVPALKLQLPHKIVVLHLCAILMAFVTLYLAAPVKPLFVLLTASIAFLTAALTRYGEALRSLGSWVFIPALYLACELHEEAHSGLRRACIILAFAPVGLALVCAVRTGHRRDTRASAHHAYGMASDGWLLAASATAIAVFAAAALVEIFNLSEGQWVIWSAASVVVGDLATSADKLKLRALGACIGVPLGLLTGLCLPVSRVGYSLALLSALLTLIALNRYVIAFGARCYFIALAASFAGNASGIAEERVTNVLIGGVFGITAVAVSEFVWTRMVRSQHD
jgi:hypothetical protein